MSESDLLVPDVEDDKGRQNFSKGVTFALLTASCAVGMSASNKWAGRALITPYTSNFVTSVVGTCIMAVLMLVQKKAFIPNFEGWRSWFFSYGLALWFFMWGTFCALRLIDLSSWQSMTMGLNQALIMIIAAATLGESIDMFKLGVLARNALVIVLISKPPFVFGGKASVPLLGLVFLFVQCSGCAVGAVMQRRLSDHPTEPLIFWGFLANVIYWFPPGVSPPQLRVPFLWPATAQDKVQNDAVLSLTFAVLAGMFEAFWYVCVGYGLKQMNAANFFFLLVPFTLAISCVVSRMLFHETIDRLTYLALGIIALGFITDRWWESRSLKRQ